MSFSLIAAVGKNLELGHQNQLLFRLKKDLQFFRKTTKDHTVVMGRKTWESLGHPLKNRRNLVVSRRPLDLPPGVEQVKNLEAFIAENADSEEEIFIIGGGEIYRLFLPHASAIYLTEIDASAPVADTFSRISSADQTSDKFCSKTPKITLNLKS